MKMKQSDLDLAKKMGFFCGEAYRVIDKKINLKNWLSEKNYFLISSGRSGSWGIYTIQDDKMIIALRGTNSKKIDDVLTDLNFELTNCKFIPKWTSGGYWVHKGFYKIYMEFRSQLRNDIKSLLKKNKMNVKQICFTGHSLGGALATICALDYTVNPIGEQPVAVYSFASPKIGTKTLVNFYNSKVKQSFRFFIKEDVVTDVPHWGLFNLIKGGGIYKRVSRGIQISPPTKGKSNPFTCHKLKYYRDCL